MGRKHQFTSDPALAKAHEAGTPVRLIQHAEHSRFGTISYEVRHLWHMHYLMARSGYIELRRRHDEVLRLPLTSNGDRLMTANSEPDLTFMVYVAGTQMIINLTLTMQHFCQEIESSLRLNLSDSTLGRRVKEAFKEADLDVSPKGYAALQEILERRDAMEHPKRKNVFNSHATHWDRVPLSWLLTERPLVAFEAWHNWFSASFKKWKLNPVQAPRNLTLTVERGRKSTRQAKKPPRE